MAEKHLYQFPMGKVKAAITAIICAVVLYQFPMGKVKEVKELISEFAGDVSIPYGKGKVS